MLSSDVKGWLNQFRIGSVGGVLIFFVYVSFLLLNIFKFSKTAGFQYSLTQGTLLKSFLLNSGYSIVGFVLSVGLGAVLGGFLRKTLE